MLSRIASTSTPLIGADAGAAGEAAFALGAEAPDCAVVTAAEDGVASGCPTILFQISPKMLTASLLC
jgi:hypothetical protein